MELNNDFETCLASLRNAHSRAISGAEAEISQLQSDLARKDAELKDLSTRLSLTENQLSLAEKRVVELSRSLSKLATFKQTVMASLQNDDDFVLDELVTGLATNANLNTNSSSARRYQTSAGLAPSRQT
ncbi:hypothetical protein HDU81_008489, partial [Chytriomyces hyalinus]